MTAHTLYEVAMERVAVTRAAMTLADLCRKYQPMVSKARGLEQDRMLIEWGSRVRDTLHDWDVKPGAMRSKLTFQFLTSRRVLTEREWKYVRRSLDARTAAGV